MRALVVYESMFGNTHEVAEGIAEGLRTVHDVEVVPADEATPEVVAGRDLVVVGAPTHAHTLPTRSSRRSAEETAAKDASLAMEADVEAEGLREWLEHLDTVSRCAAATFDTRVDAPAVVTGRASKGIARRLSRHGFRVVADPESFLVDRHNHLKPGEIERATEWGRTLAYLAP